MLRIVTSSFLLVLITSGVAVGQDAEAPGLQLAADLGDGPVFVVPVKAMIDNALARYVDRAVGDAEARGASLIVFDVDTFGGLVDAADQIRKRILDAEPPTAAFINKNAASAGALISYACDHIVMAPGSSIGAATVVEGVGGEAAPDKYQSYMRGLMRATAEANGRDPRIAEAMVDETIEVDGVSEAGKVLTLSTTEALRLLVADLSVDDVPQLLAAFGAETRAVVNHQASRVEKVLRFFASPVVQSILMLMMLGGLYFELQTPGVGFAGAMAVLGAAAFFAPHYIMGLVESWEIIVFVLGVGLLLVEIFVTPGFGVAGVGGVVLIFGSLLSALVGNVGLDFPSGETLTSAITTLAITSVLFVVLLFSLGRYLPRSDRFGQLVLQPELSASEGYTSAEVQMDLVGKVGVALTPLRPSGMAEFDGERVDVTSVSDFIPAGSTVVVRRVTGGRVEVRMKSPGDATTSA